MGGGGAEGLPEFGDVGGHFLEEVDDAGALIFPEILIHNGYNSTISVFVIDCFL